VAVLGEHVGEPESVAGLGGDPARRRGAGHDPPGPGPGQEGADGQAQLVQQARLDDLVQQVRAALGEDLPVTAASSGLSRLRSILRVTTAIGAEGARPSRSQAQRVPSVRGLTGR